MQNFLSGKQKKYFRHIMKIYAKEHPGQQAHADVIVVDPPRKGCEEALLETMVKTAARQNCLCQLRFCYIGKRFKISMRGRVCVGKNVQVVDQFPNTVHTECVTLLQRSRGKKYVRDNNKGI